MIIWIMILIIILSGTLGGYISFILPGNYDASGAPLRNKNKCIWLGITAALIIPLFLEITQSKLMDNLQAGWPPENESCNCQVKQKDSLNLAISLDTAGKMSRDSIKIKGAKNPSTELSAIPCCVPIKNYFLFAAYCLVAASAGLRFINNVTDKVITEKQLANVKEEIKNVKTEKEKVEQERNEAVKKEKVVTQAVVKRAKNAQLGQLKESKDVIKDLAKASPAIASNMFLTNSGDFDLPKITNRDDPQKGRFGGNPIAQGRELSAKVEPAFIDGFYKVSLTVSQLQGSNNELTGPVIFYLHDSFHPSVVLANAENGKATYEVISYGAFTVGALADDGSTRLELDLSQLPDVPAEFASR